MNNCIKIFANSFAVDCGSCPNCWFGVRGFGLLLEVNKYASTAPAAFYAQFSFGKSWRSVAGAFVEIECKYLFLFASGN